MSLTDDWKSGKLARGKKYWCRMVGGEIEICYLWLQTNQFTLLVGYQSRDLPEDDIIEILAPCNYDYISELQSKNKHLLDLQANQDKEVERLRDENKELIGLRKEVVKEEEIIGKLLNEGNVLAVKNRKLRELLWECLSHLSSDGISVTPLNILLDKINEVLGNDK